MVPCVSCDQILEKIIAAKDEKERVEDAHERHEGLESYVDMQRKMRGEMEQVGG